MQRFTDRRIIVTGAGSGIGRATALRLASEGGRVVAADVSPEGLAATAAEAETHGVGALVSTHVIDVGDEASVDEGVAAALATLGGLDVLVNAAGILRSGHTHEFTLDTFNLLVRINLTGTFLMTKAALPTLLATGNGVVVNFGSTSAQFGHPYMAAYAATKGAIVSFTHSLALEYCKQGLRAVSVCPGGVTTALTDAVPSGLPADTDWGLFTKITPPTGFGKPDHVAGVIAMLASDDGAYITGTEIRIDGGTHA
jgi:NAD(P)-dependent dehydrogenase (short-subunit alcohol dehydrogenase family)